MQLGAENDPERPPNDLGEVPHVELDASGDANARGPFPVKDTVCELSTGPV